MSALKLLTSLAGKPVTKSTLDKVIKTAKSYIKKNPGKSRVDILKNLETKYNIPFLRPEGKLSRGKMIPYPSHGGADFIKIFLLQINLKKLTARDFLPLRNCSGKKASLEAKSI